MQFKIQHRQHFQNEHSHWRFRDGWISVIDGTIGGLIDLCLREAQTLKFGACRLPETRWTQNAINFSRRDDEDENLLSRV